MSRVPRLLNAVLRLIVQVIDSGDTETLILGRCNACQYAWYIIHAASAGAEATALRHQPCQRIPVWAQLRCETTWDKSLSK
jgi:hypothetical protein